MSEALLIDAIKNKYNVFFKYEGDLHVAVPHLLFVNKQNQLILKAVRRNVAEDKKFVNYYATDMQQLSTVAKFSGIEDGFDPNDDTIFKILAKL